MSPIHCGRGNKTINAKTEEEIFIALSESEIPFLEKKGTQKVESSPRTTAVLRKFVT